MRVYLPGTVRTLRTLMDTGELGPPPLTGFAVTPGLREWYTDDDVDELEYQALVEAARGSLRLLDDDRTAARRRVVISAEVPDSAVTPRPDLDRAVVRVGIPVPMRLVASVHVDGPEAEPAIRAAAAATLEAELGSEEAKFLMDEAEGHELLWYATQEVPILLELF